MSVYRWGMADRTCMRSAILLAALSLTATGCADPSRFRAFETGPSCRRAVTKDGTGLRICETGDRVTVEETGPASRDEIRAYFRLTPVAERRGDAALAAPPPMLSTDGGAGYGGPAR
jgi:hypothetical protein